MNRVTVINMLSVRPGKMEAFIAAQQDFSNAMTGRSIGLIGGRMYRSVGSDKTVLVSQFESADAQQAIVQGKEFQQHLAILKEMVESSSPGLFEEVYTTGAFA